MDPDEHLKFDEGVAREGVDANGGADVLAVVAEELDEKIGGTVDNGGGAVEAGDAVDIAVDGDDFGDGVEGAEFAFEDGELGEGAGAGGVVAIGDGAILPDGAGDDAGSIRGDDAGEIDDVADTLGRKVVAAGVGGRGEG